MNKENIKKYTGMTIAVLLSPFVVVLFVMDRAILLPLIWLDAPGFKDWAKKGETVGMSLVRVTAIFSIYGLYMLFRYMLT